MLLTTYWNFLLFDIVKSRNRKKVTWMICFQNDYYVVESSLKELLSDSNTTFAHLWGLTDTNISKFALLILFLEYEDIAFWRWSKVGKEKNDLDEFFSEHLLGCREWPERVIKLFQYHFYKLMRSDRHQHIQISTFNAFLQLWRFWYFTWSKVGKRKKWLGWFFFRVTIRMSTVAWASNYAISIALLHTYRFSKISKIMILWDDFL